MIEAPYIFRNIHFEMLHTNRTRTDNILSILCGPPEQILEFHFYESKTVFNTTIRKPPISPLGCSRVLKEACLLVWLWDRGHWRKSVSADFVFILLYMPLRNGTKTMKCCSKMTLFIVLRSFDWSWIVVCVCIRYALVCLLSHRYVRRDHQFLTYVQGQNDEGLVFLSPSTHSTLTSQPLINTRRNKSTLL
jgi:hypothetical protein